MENRLIRSGCCPLFKDKFYKIVKKHTIKVRSDTSANEDNSFRNHIRYPKMISHRFL